MQKDFFILDDSSCRESLYPFTLTRHAADIRVGIFTLREKWEQILAKKLDVDINENDNSINIPAHILPSLENYTIIMQAARDNVLLIDSKDIRYLHHASDIAQHAVSSIIEDVSLLLASQNVIENFSSGKSQNKDVYIHKTANIESCYFNTDDGPVIIDEGATVMQGAMLRGPVYIGKNSVVKMGAALYSGVSLGNYCTAGGEIKNAVFFDYTNKGHEGYLGDSVLGNWCNLGAGTTCSNLKNTASEVMYQMPGTSVYKTGRIKGGLLMGDYSRTAINTSFNTATTVGVSCNLFDVHFTQKYFPSFTWGNERYNFNKAIEHTNNWMRLKNKELSTTEIQQLENIYKTL